LTLEKERLFTIYHGCIQELSRKNDRLEAENVAKNQRITALENQNKKLVEDIESIKKHLNI